MIRRLLIAAVLAPALASAQQPATWKFSGTADAGFVSATGNTDVVTTNFGDKVTASFKAWTFTQTLAQVYGKTKGVESANQLRAGLRTERTLVDGVGGFAAVQYERNAFAGFNRRLDELLGVQWKAIADSSNTLTLDAGGVLTQQENTDGTTKNTPAARAAAAFKHLFKANTFFSQGVEYVPDLQAGGGYRVNSETAAVAPLASRINVKIGYVVQYNSKPPAKFGTTDRVFTSGLQVSF
jgi:putative salt-induced outer membrane protein YdiY